MITIQHTLIGYLLLNSVSFNRQLPYMLLPDAIRMYTGARQYSHFEESEDGEDCSWMKYPVDLNELNNEYASKNGHLVDGIRLCCMGEATIIGKFVNENIHLPIYYFKGVFNHLVQDAVFDDFIRQYIDCTQMYEDIFMYDGRRINGKEVRELITEIEQYGFYYLASLVYEKSGIIANQQWFDNTIKPLLFEIYPEKLAENTYKYMRIDEVINKRITNLDFGHIDDGPLSLADYEEMYANVEYFTKIHTNYYGV